MPAKKEQKKQEGPEPNIKFVGKPTKDAKGEEVPAEPLRYIEHGMEKRISLPEPEEQAAGFYHDRAGEIIRLFPHLYKAVVIKGE